MAKVGAPKGNSNGKNGSKARQALTACLTRRSTRGIDELIKIWDVVCEKALNGDLPAAQEIFNRLDGKPGQTLDLGGSETVIHFNLDYGKNAD